MIPNREDAEENTRKMKSDYATVASHLRPMAWKIETMICRSKSGIRSP